MSSIIYLFHRLCIWTALLLLIYLIKAMVQDGSSQNTFRLVPWFVAAIGCALILVVCVIPLVSRRIAQGKQNIRALLSNLSWKLGRGKRRVSQTDLFAIRQLVRSEIKRHFKVVWRDRDRSITRVLCLFSLRPVGFNIHITWFLEERSEGSFEVSIRSPNCLLHFCADVLEGIVTENMCLHMESLSEETVKVSVFNAAVK